MRHPFPFQSFQVSLLSVSGSWYSAPSPSIGPPLALIFPCFSGRWTIGAPEPSRLQSSRRPWKSGPWWSSHLAKTPSKRLNKHEKTWNKPVVWWNNHGSWHLNRERVAGSCTALVETSILELAQTPEPARLRRTARKGGPEARQHYHYLIGGFVNISIFHLYKSSCNSWDHLKIIDSNLFSKWLV